MKNIDKGLTMVPINWLKIAQMPNKLFTRIVCQSPKVRDFDEKRLQWLWVVSA
jgi:hypothetical protein